MTAHKHLKQLVRARMQKTGERYAAARRHVVRATDGEFQETAPHRRHFAGQIPATTALRALAAQAGLRAAHDGRPYSEAMLFGIAGGIGIGVFAFRYAKEDVSTFFVAGRHRWHDDLAYLRGALERLGAGVVVRETTGAKTAERELQDALRDGTCVVWCDAATLPHRAMPAQLAGGSYHVVTVYGVDPESGTTSIGDLTDTPIDIALADLTRARGRIKKDRFRLVSATTATKAPDLHRLVVAGLRSCHQELLHPTLPGATGNATLGALQAWAQRMHGSKDAQSWERTFRPGANLWRGLCGIHDFIEHYGTGGGLCRPMFADFLGEAAQALGDARLETLAHRYADIGRQWSDLAEAALPDDVSWLGDAKMLLVRKAELLHAGAPAGEVAAVWREFQALEARAGERFPLSDAAAGTLRKGLRDRILSLHDAEVGAHSALGTLLA